MNLFSEKEALQIIVASIFVGLIFSYPSFESVEIVKYTLFYLVALTGKTLIMKRIAFLNGLGTEFKIFIPSMIFSLFLLLYGLKIPIPGYFSFGSFKFGRFKFFSKYPSVNEVGRVVTRGIFFNILMAFFGVVFNSREFIVVNILQSLTSLIPFLPFEGGAVFFYDYFIWLALMMLSLIILIFG